MIGKLKMWIDVFGKITTGVILAAACFITGFWGSTAELHTVILWQILLVSFLCSLGVFMFPADGQKELSKGKMLVRQLVYFVFVNVVVLAMGNMFEWFSFSNRKMVGMMELSIVAVFVLIWSISYLNDYMTAKNMNRKLIEKREKHGSKEI